MFTNEVTCVLPLQKKQPSFTYEVIIVNDGSTDRTSEVGERESRRQQNLTFLRNEEMSLSSVLLASN